MVNHLIGFGAGSAGEQGEVGDVTSYSLNGTTDYLSVADHANWFMSTGNYTVEIHVKHTDHAGTESYVSHITNGDNRWELRHIHGTGIDFLVRNSAVTEVSLTGSEITDTNWHHVAITKSGTTWRLFLDGNIEATSVDADTDADYTGILAIGARGGGEFFDGNIDEPRISDIARWTSNFTPNSTLQYTSDANTLLLIHCSETKTGTTGSGATFTDSGNTGHTVTEVGSAIEDTVTYKF